MLTICAAASCVLSLLCMLLFVFQLTGSGSFLFFMHNTCMPALPFMALFVLLFWREYRKGPGGQLKLMSVLALVGLGLTAAGPLVPLLDMGNDALSHVIEALYAPGWLLLSCYLLYLAWATGKSMKPFAALCYIAVLASAVVMAVPEIISKIGLLPEYHKISGTVLNGIGRWIYRLKPTLLWFGLALGAFAVCFAVRLMNERRGASRASAREEAATKTGREPEARPKAKRPPKQHKAKNSPVIENPPKPPKPARRLPLWGGILLAICVLLIAGAAVWAFWGKSLKPAAQLFGALQPAAALVELTTQPTTQQTTDDSKLVL